MINDLIQQLQLRQQQPAMPVMPGMAAPAPLMPAAPAPALPAPPPESSVGDSQKGQGSQAIMQLIKAMMGGG